MQSTTEHFFGLMNFPSLLSCSAVSLMENCFIQIVYRGSRGLGKLQQSMAAGLRLKTGLSILIYLRCMFRRV
jgi:hypothetical protein